MQQLLTKTRKYVNWTLLLAFKLLCSCSRLDSNKLEIVLLPIIVPIDVGVWMTSCFVFRRTLCVVKILSSLTHCDIIRSNRNTIGFLHYKRSVATNGGQFFTVASFIEINFVDNGMHTALSIELCSPHH